MATARRTICARSSSMPVSSSTSWSSRKAALRIHPRVLCGDESVFRPVRSRRDLHPWRHAVFRRHHCRGQLRATRSPGARADDLSALRSLRSRSRENETLMNDNLEVIILAAGLGTRMKSETIKILHRAAGRPIIDYVLDLAAGLTSRPPVMVIGHQRDAVQKSVGDRARFALQEEQLGTGHAVLQAAPAIESTGDTRVLILSGDVPLTRPETLRGLVEEHEHS